MERIKSHPIITVLIIEGLIALVLGAFGFRITYNPELENSWDAIEAVGTWVCGICGLIIPFAVLWVQKRIEDSERKTGESNAATIEEVMRLLEMQSKSESTSTKEKITDQQVYNIIRIHMFITTEDIAKELGVEVSEIAENLKTLYSERKIWNLNGFGNIRNGVEGCKWKPR